VIQTMTPSGVEQFAAAADRSAATSVIQTMTPSGVEQRDAHNVIRAKAG